MRRPLASVASVASRASTLVVTCVTLSWYAPPLHAQRPASRTAPPVATRPADTAVVRRPAAGSAERAALMNAIRAAVRTTSRFRVHDVRVAGAWAFVHATEVVALDGDELQETDLTAMALLQRAKGTPTGRWRVVELWTLPTEARRAHADFTRAVLERQRRAGFPAGLVPDELR